MSRSPVVGELITDIRSHALALCVLITDIRSHALALCVLITEVRSHALALCVLITDIRSHALALCVLITEVRSHALAFRVGAPRLVGEVFCEKPSPKTGPSLQNAARAPNISSWRV